MGESWLDKLKGAAKLLGMNTGPEKEEAPASLSDRGMLVFSNTSEVIAAERLLGKAGFEVEVKGPPPDLQTGCDMVVIFPVLKLAAIQNVLRRHKLDPEKIVSASDILLDPVSLFHVSDLGRWLMVRAANMKITVEKKSGVIVNISGGGCPDVPWLAAQLCGKRLCDAPAPVSIGHTLCCYSLQKAYEELGRRLGCGS